MYKSISKFILCKLIKFKYYFVFWVEVKFGGLLVLLKYIENVVENCKKELWQSVIYSRNVCIKLFSKVVFEYNAYNVFTFPLKIIFGFFPIHTFSAFA